VSLLLALFALTHPVPAGAQALVPVKVVTAEYVRCVAQRDLTAAHKVVVERADTPAWADAMNRLIDSRDSCVRNPQLSFRREDARGAMGEYLLERDLRLVAYLAARPADKPAPAAAAEPATFGMLVAQCVAGAEPSRSLAVLQTDIATQPEREAMMALKPVINQCLPATGRQQLTISDLRNYLAVALYQIAHAATVGRAEVR
jgi:hypothetical protein